ncbi:MAG TPA: ribosome-associated translation inhibitor RaiA, partial [Deltaproteobacteria bacterium]|nr:ribosome-associated translation inhibitor RaiA [Deltaproteobacteria bacterium]
YIEKPVEARVVLSVEKYRNFAEVNLIMAKGGAVNAREEASEMIPAIDAVVDKLERQLKKQKEKMRSRKEPPRKVIAEGLADVPAEEADEDEQYRVVESRKVVLSPMSVDEAAMNLEETGDRFMLFRDSASENVMVMYRRDDGSYELIEAAG